MLLLVSLLSAILASEAAKFPKTWTACKMGDPGLDECIRQAAEFAIHDMVNGKPSLGVTPLDPLRFEQVSIDKGSGPVSIKLDFRDLDAVGIKDLKLKSAKMDWKELDVEFEVPSKLTLQGKYKISGKVLILPINGEGDCKLDLDRAFGHAKLKFSQIEKDGKSYYQIDSVNFTIDTDRLNLHFENLFNGDKALGDNMNVFLNENWKEILNELRPSVAGAFGAAFKEIGNRVFSRIESNVISPS